MLIGAVADILARSRRVSPLFIRIGCLFVIFESVFVILSYCARQKLVSSTNVLLSENRNMKVILSNLTHLENKKATRVQIMQALLDSNSSIPPVYFERDDGQPLRLRRLSHRPEIRDIIEREIFNKTQQADRWRQRLLPDENPDFWMQRRFKTTGKYGFIQFSGYRAGPHQFAAIGLHCKAMKESRSVEVCKWWGRDGRQLVGNLTMLLEDNVESGDYEVAVLTCDLPSDTGPGGGHVVARVDQEEFVMFVEEPGKAHPLALSGNAEEGPFQFDLIFCSTCFHDSMAPRHVWEFLEFNRVIHAVDHFFFYDGGAMDSAFLSAIAPYRSAGLLTVTDIREVLLFSVLYWGQTVAANDCMYRNRFSAKWIIFMDVDEYIQVRPGQTLKGLLAEPTHRDAAFLTHGTYLWSTKHCMKQPADSAGSQQGLFLVQRMLFRSSRPSCSMRKWRAEMCWEAYGHRKLIVNPRKVSLCRVHSADECPGEKHVDVEVGRQLWHSHFPGVGAGYNEAALCLLELDPEDMRGVPENYTVDRSLASLVPLVRDCPLGAAAEGCRQGTMARRQKGG